MELLLKAKIENLFKAKDFKDKDSGEITPGKWKLQTFDNIETENGTQMKLVDISIPDGEVSKYQEKIGQTVTIPVGTYISKGRVGYYGLGA
jgi:hypothetical protein